MHSDIQNVVLLNSVEIDAATYAEAKPLNPPTKSYYWKLSAADANPLPDDEEEDDDTIEGG